MSQAPSPVPPLTRPPGFLPAWPGPVQLAMAFLLGVTTTLLAIQSFGLWRWGGRPSEVQPTQIVYRVDLNRADRAELLQLPGVGDALARRIEDHRGRSGGFRSIEELQEVSGIGPATLENLRNWVYVDTPGPPPENASPSPRTVSAAPAVKVGSKKIASLSEPIHLNQATVEELQRLPGIGPKLSQRIVEERQKSAFRSVDDLDRVPGIGPKTVERLRPYVITSTKMLATKGN